MIAPTWNDELELFDGSYSMSDIQIYIKYIIKNSEHYPLILLFIYKKNLDIIMLIYNLSVHRRTKLSLSI